MADKDDFSFDKDSTPTPPVTPEAPARKKAQPAPSRALLLGLLLVVLGGAAYFYSIEMMAPEEVTVPPAVTKQLITPPPAPPPAPATETAPGAKQSAVAAETAGQTPAQGQDSVSAAATEPQPEVKEVPKLAEKGGLQEVPIEAPKPIAEPSATAPAVASQPARGAYTLLAGAYIFPETMKMATSKVRKLGYQPRTLRNAKMVEMIRVRIGAFAPEEARAKLMELKTIAPDAFTLPEGEQVAVYAASHFDPKAHQVFAAKLRQAGVAFEEEKAMLKLPLTELFFGEFNDRAAAEKVASQARKAGLDIIVFKRP